VTVALGSIIALVGVIIGQLLARGGEYRKWLRTEHHVACARLLEVCELIHVRASNRDAIQAAAKRGAESITVDSVPEAKVMMDQIFAQLAEHLSMPQAQVASMREETEKLLAPELLKAVHAEILAKYEGDTVSWLSETRQSWERLTFAKESLRLVAPPAVVTAADDLAAKASALISDDTGTFDERRSQYKASRHHFVEVARRFLHRQLVPTWSART
jgi:hypothetical protein